jgi:hypothetical protein
MAKPKAAEQPVESETGLKKAAGAIGKAVGTVAKAVGLASAPKPSGKLPPKNKTRLPRKQKKAAKKTA